MNGSRMLKEQDAARYIAVSVPFLRQARCKGNRPGYSIAPPFVRLGGKGSAVRYDKTELDRWIEERKEVAKAHN